MKLIRPLLNCAKCNAPSCVYLVGDLCPECQRNNALAVEALSRRNAGLNCYGWETFGRGRNEQVDYLFRKEEV